MILKIIHLILENLFENFSKEFEIIYMVFKLFKRQNKSSYIWGLKTHLNKIMISKIKMIWRWIYTKSMNKTTIYSRNDSFLNN
jgi:hypothetical protein